MPSASRFRLSYDVHRNLNYCLTCRLVDNFNNDCTFTSSRSVFIDCFTPHIPAIIDLISHFQCRSVDNLMLDDCFSCRLVDNRCSTNSLATLLCSDFREIRYCGELLQQLGKKCQAITPDPFILGHHHHFLEEPVHSFPQSRDDLQRFLIPSAPFGSLYASRRLSHCSVQLAF